jgi:hypothetical protein
VRISSTAPSIVADCAVRAVVIISGMCSKGALDRGREDSGCEER